METKHQRYVERLEQLIAEGEALAQSEQPSKKPGIKTIQDHTKLHAWLIKVENIIETTFGQNSPHFKRKEELFKGKTYYASQVRFIVGLLTGALDDLKNGFLVRQEFLIAGEIFKSVLEQGKYFFDKGHKDAAAIYARIVVEERLKGMAKQAGIDLSDSQKPGWRKSAAKLNYCLKDEGQYGEPQWSQIQAWIKVGNSAAHGKFNEYDHEQVRLMLEGIEHFLTTTNNPIGD
ncbi:MAG TPA: hypothetical protein ENG03_09920 [Thioploca sp.]|nr:MAG: hypothetical protein B6247_27510 [Beggiatoa sp. 4572_84]RKZ55551.1 MAG: hypothetical protein DRR08_24030 [Gammaproteobacteria bacterium]HDN27392.1 hypothetical protein [Thioploca sp.]